ncbi:MAG TPA: HAD family hydrolase [Aggregatilineales bacterium]|nr:HAD family hydrolase [Aggregatilineales bacterium]
MTISTLIFDMDGVITTEEKYWACARLTLWELVTQTLHLPNAMGDAVHSADARAAVVADNLIYLLKDRAVNSNWDSTYILACAYLAELDNVRLYEAADLADLLLMLEADAAQVGDRVSVEWPGALIRFLKRTEPLTGHALIAAAGRQLEDAASYHHGDLLKPDREFWQYLRDRFQRFYHGDTMRDYDGDPLIDGTAIPAPAIEATLRGLRDAGFTLGTATGRPSEEIQDALGALGLLHYFDPARFGTQTTVRLAEAATGRQGLGKPHPYSLLRALYPDAHPERLLDPAFQAQSRPGVLMIGDAPGDPMMARAAGCRCVGVLTGVRGEAARRSRERLLVEAGCEAVLPDMTALPAWLEAEGRVNVKAF